jgi:hypothetical protein
MTIYDQNICSQQHPHWAPNLTLLVLSHFFASSKTGPCRLPTSFVVPVQFVLGREGTRSSWPRDKTTLFSRQEAAKRAGRGTRQGFRRTTTGLAGRRAQPSSPQFACSLSRPVQLLWRLPGAVLAPWLLNTVCCAALGRSVGVWLGAGATQATIDGPCRVQRGAQ